jgi:hypothetical protein
MTQEVPIMIDDVLFEIFQFLDNSTILNVLLSNHHFSTIIDSPIYWKQRFLNCTTSWLKSIEENNDWKLLYSLHSRFKFSRVYKAQNVEISEDGYSATNSSNGSFELVRVECSIPTSGTITIHFQGHLTKGTYCPGFTAVAMVSGNMWPTDVCSDEFQNWFDAAPATISPECAESYTLVESADNGYTSLNKKSVWYPEWTDIQMTMKINLEDTSYENSEESEDELFVVDKEIEARQNLIGANETRSGRVQFFSKNNILSKCYCGIYYPLDPDAVNCENKMYLLCSLAADLTLTITGIEYQPTW